jgi:hypothetical protein
MQQDGLECAGGREGRQVRMPGDAEVAAVIRLVHRDGLIARCGHLRASYLEGRSWTGRLRAADP